jgi:hypothetical protein
VWVGDWGLGFEGFERHWGFRDSYGTVRPDASLELGAPDGLAIVVALEWGRGTEPLEVLCGNVAGYAATRPSGPAACYRRVRGARQGPLRADEAAGEEVDPLALEWQRRREGELAEA